MSLAACRHIFSWWHKGTEELLKNNFSKGQKKICKTKFFSKFMLRYFADCFNEQGAE
jgi:hypothetical protein